MSAAPVILCAAQGKRRLIGMTEQAKKSKKRTSLLTMLVIAILIHW